jgi:quercetin dioxygenase-like cupin family protein
MTARKREKKSTGKIPTAKAMDLASLVDYAEASIVSRTIAENKAGTLTLFAFAAGQGLSEHQAPFDAVVQVLDGEAELRIGGRKVLARAGQLVVMPASVPHAVKAPRRFKMLLTMLRAPAAL